MSILVTGGAGYIGSHTCVELLHAGFDIIILDNLMNSKRQSLERIEELGGRPFKFYRADLRDRPALDTVFAENEVEAVIHFAGLKAVGESSKMPLEYYENNVGGTINLCMAMRDAGCKALVFSSSATVYGSANPSPLRETMPVGGTTNPYGTTKLFIERILQDLYAADKDWAVSLLRYFNPIGAHISGRIGEDPQGLPNNLMPFIAQVAVGRREYLPVFGDDYDTRDGTCIRDYIHVVDLARGHIHALRKVLDAPGCDIYNLGTGNGCSVFELITAFEKAAGVRVRYNIEERRAGDIPECYSDPGKARRELGWTAQKTIDDMCADTWRWQKNNPRGYDD